MRVIRETNLIYVKMFLLDNYVYLPKLTVLNSYFGYSIVLSRLLCPRPNLVVIYDCLFIRTVSADKK